MKRFFVIILLVSLFSGIAIFAQIVRQDLPQVNEPLQAQYGEYGAKQVYKAFLDFDIGLVKTAEYKVMECLREFPNAPTTSLAIFLKANVDLQNGNYHIAVWDLERFTEAHSNSPFVPIANLFCGYILLEAKDYAGAEVKFKQTIELSEKAAKIRLDDKERYEYISHSANYWCAVAICQQSRYYDAIPYFQRTFMSETDDNLSNYEYAAQAIYALGVIAEMNSDLPLANKHWLMLDSHYRYSNVSVPSYLRYANDNLLLRNPKNAIMSLQKADNAMFHINEKDSIGLLYRQQEFNANFKENSLYLKAEASNGLQQYSQSIPIFQELISSFPNSSLLPNAYMGIGWAELNQGNYNAAIFNFNKVIELEHNTNSTLSATAHINKISALKKLGKIEEAQQELSMLSVQPNFPLIAFVDLELGQIYYERGEYEQARKTLERAEREANNHKVSIRISALLAASYFELDMFSKAAEMYGKTEKTALNVDSILVPNRNWYRDEARVKQGISLVLANRYNESITPLLKYIAERETTHTMLDEATFWLAEAYYRMDMLKNAAINYAKITADYRSSSRREEAMYGEGWSYFRQKDFSKSSAAFDRLVKEFPKSKFATEVLTRQADGYYQIKNYVKASEYYSKAASQDPSSDDAQYAAYQLAHTLYRQTQYEKAVTAGLQFVRKYPKSQLAPNALYLVAWIRFQQEKYPAAIENFHFLIETYPQSNLVPRAYFAIGDAEYNQGNYEHALEDYKIVVEQFPSSDLVPNALQSVQQVYLVLDRNEEAISVANQYINNNPSSPFVEDFQYKKADMFYTGRKYQDAITEYQDFVKKYPTGERTAEALYWLGKSFVAVNDFDNASRTFMELKNKFPKNDFAANGLLEYALMLKQQNMPDSALTILGIIENDFHTNDAAPQAAFEKAVIYFGLNDTLKAMEQYKYTAATYPETDYSDQSTYRLAMYYRFRGLNESAVAEFQKIAVVYDNPTIASEATYRIGELQLKMGNTEEARKQFEIIQDKFAGYEDWFSLAMLSLGEIYERMGRKDEAKEIYIMIQQIRPDDEFGKTASMRLKKIK